MQQPHRYTYSVVCSSTLIILSAIGALLLIDLKPAQAQARFGNFGITTPAQRFFSAGREQVEREIRHLQTPDSATQNLLTVDDDVYIQNDLLCLEVLNPELMHLEPPDSRSEEIPSGTIGPCPPVSD